VIDDGHRSTPVQFGAIPRAQTIEAPIAIGELIDKITILEIKVARISNATKAANAKAELALLCQRRDVAIPPDPALDAIAVRLKTINERIWELEDTVRACERHQDFGPVFIAAARAIYRTNDERAAVKREINVAMGSDLIEEKSYARY
jgi:hypothetical protein